MKKRELIQPQYRLKIVRDNFFTYQKHWWDKPHDGFMGTIYDDESAVSTIFKETEVEVIAEANRRIASWRQQQFRQDNAKWVKL